MSWVVHVKPNITILLISVEGHTKNIFPLLFYEIIHKCIGEEEGHDFMKYFNTEGCTTFFPKEHNLKHHLLVEDLNDVST